MPNTDTLTIAASVATILTLLVTITSKKRENRKLISTIKVHPFLMPIGTNEIVALKGELKDKLSKLNMSYNLFEILISNKGELPIKELSLRFGRMHYAVLEHASFTRSMEIEDGKIKLDDIDAHTSLKIYVWGSASVHSYKDIGITHSDGISKIYLMPENRIMHPSNLIEHAIHDFKKSLNEIIPYAAGIIIFFLLARKFGWVS